MFDKYIKGTVFLILSIFVFKISVLDKFKTDDAELKSIRKVSSIKRSY